MKGKPAAAPLAAESEVHEIKYAGGRTEIDVEVPQEIAAAAGWKEGDMLVWRALTYGVVVVEVKR